MGLCFSRQCNTDDSTSLNTLNDTADVLFYGNFREICEKFTYETFSTTLVFGVKFRQAHAFIIGSWLNFVIQKYFILSLFIMLSMKSCDRETLT